ncbi:MAG: stage II sporulation protein P [Clostridia bacterium]|nr:stage II sporulation protein P [Clostridia bacterium]
MHVFKQSPLKTFIVSKNTVDKTLFAITSIFVLITVFIITSISIENKGFVRFVIDKFIGNTTVYAEFSEIFTDSKGRVNAILGGYTMIVGENEEALPSPSPNTSAPKPSQIPQVVENTSSALTEIKNQSGKTVDAEKLISEPLSFVQKGKKPTVLIIHTHTTESYLEQDRSVDDSKNMIAVGKVVKEKLSNAGISVIHDTTVHDYPSYNGAYTRAAATTNLRLKENPDINIILDIHRDAIASDDGSKLSLVTEIDGKKTAQLMFVVGTDSQLTHNKWNENLKLALKLQRKANELYPTLMRPINLREQRFNQQLSEGSVILEVGTNGNSIEEAKQGAALISDVIIKVLNNN